MSANNGSQYERSTQGAKEREECSPHRSQLTLRYNRRMPPAPGAPEQLGWPERPEVSNAIKGLATPRKRSRKSWPSSPSAAPDAAGSPACVEYWPGGRLHVLGCPTRTSALRPLAIDPSSASAARSAEQRPRRLLPRRLPLGPPSQWSTPLKWKKKSARWRFEEQPVALTTRYQHYLSS